MSNKKTVFNFKIVNDDQPLKDDPFYSWLLDKKEKQTNRLESTIEYLKSIGFDESKNIIEPSNIETLNYILDIYYRCFESIKRENGKLVLLSSLHDPKGNKTFNICNRDKFTDFNFCPSQELLEVLDNDGLVYEINSEHFYFEIINNNRLFIKYQYIIGSRFICTIENDLF